MWAVAAMVAVSLLPCVTSQYQVHTPEIWHVNEYPDPWFFYHECNRDNRSAICDPNRIISKKDADEIDELIESVARDTRCTCYHCVTNKRGYVIRVALMEQLQQLVNTTDTIMGELKNARLFAYLLTQRWKLVGNCNETLLILYSRRDKALYTITGSQAGQLLKDDLIVEISVDVRPFFDDREGIAEGLKEMIRRYKAV